MAGKNGNGREGIKTPLELEKEELRRLIRDFHPDKFMQASAEDRQRVENMVKMLNALSEIHENKKLISENGWPKGTPAPKEIPLVAVAPDGALIRINSTLNGEAFTPAAYFEKVREFHKDPVAFLAAVRERNRTQQAQTHTRRTTRGDDWLNDILRNTERHNAAREADERARQSAARAAQQQRVYEEEVRQRRYREEFHRAEAARRAAAEEERVRREQSERVERDKKEKAEMAAAEAKKREEEESRRVIAEHDRLSKEIGEHFGLRVTKFDSKFFSKDTIEAQNTGLKEAGEILREVGPGISYLRGFSLLVPMTETHVRENVRRLEVNPKENREMVVGTILEGIQRIRLAQEAVGKLKNAIDSLKELKPLSVIETQFAKLTPEQIIEFKNRVRSAVDQAERGWILKSPLVHHAAIHLSAIDDTNARYRLSRTDPSKKTSLILEIGIAASQPVLVGLVNTAGDEIEKFYPASILAPHKVPLLGELIERKFKIHFSAERGDPKAITPERQLLFLERLHSALEKIDLKDRHWLSDMVVNAPNEGIRLLGRNIGSRKAWVTKNQFRAPYDVSEESIFAALKTEIQKKKNA